jgi:hypothetical protein
MPSLRPALLAVSLLAAPTFAVAPAVADTTQDGGGHHGSGFFRSMSPEARMMMFVEMRRATANMSDDQKQAYRQDQRAKFMAMSDADKQQYVARLESEWNALPADQKSQIQQQMQEWRSEHHDHDGGHGGQ